MPTPIAALEGRVALNAGKTILNWEKFDIKITADDIVVRTFESVVVSQGISQAYENRLGGFVVAAFTGGGYWDADQSPHAAPPLIRAGLYLLNVYGYVRKSGTRRFVFPSILALNVGVTADATGANKVMVNLDAKSNGAFQYPL